MTGLGFTKASRTMSERQANENHRNCRWSVRKSPTPRNSSPAVSRTPSGSTAATMFASARWNTCTCGPRYSSKSVPLVCAKFERWITISVGPSPAVNATT